MMGGEAGRETKRECSTDNAPGRIEATRFQGYPKVGNSLGEIERASGLTRKQGLQPPAAPFYAAFWRVSGLLAGNLNCSAQALRCLPLRFYRFRELLHGRRSREIFGYGSARALSQ